jgi:hypothetical protein
MTRHYNRRTGVCLFASLLFVLVQWTQAQVAQPPNYERKDAPLGVRWDQDSGKNTSQESLAGATVKVTVDASKLRNFMAPLAMGMHTSVYDNHMMDPLVPSLLRATAITTLRYPGGGYADNYHWSTYKPTRWQAEEPPKYGYYAPNNDFGHFVSLIDKVGTAIITVNYGSNLAGTGPGEPAEAAAWVAYCNGSPDDTKVIGKDSTGYDWKTIGFWATIRSISPLETDDGFNFLRISHPEPLHIRYWEIGNEVFGNGYYGDRDKNGGFEEDLHAPYSRDAAETVKLRKKNPALSPTAYGKGVVAFARSMKAVDPSIRIGAVLNTPPMDNSWGTDWNPGVLKECGPEIDFVVVHWYTGNYAPPDWKVLDNASLLAASQDEIPKMAAALVELFQKYGGAKASTMQLAVTELGSRPNAPVTNPLVFGLFTADAYASLMEIGAVNIDWLELHAQGFLDEKSQQGPAYYGIQMTHVLLNMKDQFVEAKSNNRLLTVHAAKRADGSVGIMLINKDSKNAATVKVQVSGAQLSNTGFRFDYGQSSPTTGYPITRHQVSDVGNSFSVSVPAYTITNFVIPPAK